MPDKGDLEWKTMFALALMRGCESPKTHPEQKAWLCPSSEEMATKTLNEL